MWTIENRFQNATIFSVILQPISQYNMWIVDVASSDVYNLKIKYQHWFSAWIQEKGISYTSEFYQPNTLKPIYEIWPENVHFASKYEIHLIFSPSFFKCFYFCCPRKFWILANYFIQKRWHIYCLSFISRNQQHGANLRVH